MDVRRKPTSSLNFLSAAVSVPHPDKLRTHGEDATLQLNNALGVFDGVGGWKKEGIDSGKYSRGLAALIRLRLYDQPRTSVSDAVAFAIANNVHKGTSTACVSTIQNGRMKGLNVGDSRLVVYRKGHLVFSTKHQEHSFNHPYQIGSNSFEDLRKAHLFDFKLRQGDIVILATDGLWDNVFIKDISNIVTKHEATFDRDSSKLKFEATWRFQKRFTYKRLLEEQPKEEHDRSGKKLIDLALDIAGQASCNARSHTVQCPFQVKAQQAKQHVSNGGKLDDISVVVALVAGSSRRYRAKLEAKCPNCSAKKKK